MNPNKFLLINTTFPKLCFVIFIFLNCGMKAAVRTMP